MPGAEYFSTFDSVVLDQEGFIQCAIHRQRRYGWRSPSHSPRFSGLSDIQFERLIVWGEKPKPEKFHYVPENDSIPDLRPHIYEGMLDEHALGVIARVANGNGGATHRPTSEAELLAALDEIQRSEVSRSSEGGSSLHTGNRVHGEQEGNLH